jgi:hypothetical protein
VSVTDMVKVTLIVVGIAALAMYAFVGERSFAEPGAGTRTPGGKAVRFRGRRRYQTALMDALIIPFAVLEVLLAQS